MAETEFVLPDFIVCETASHYNADTGDKDHIHIGGLPGKFYIYQVKVVLSSVQFSSVQFSCSVVSDSLRPHESQHARPPCPSPSPGVHSDSRPSSP